MIEITMPSSVISSGIDLKHEKDEKFCSVTQTEQVLFNCLKTYLHTGISFVLHRENAHPVTHPSATTAAQTCIQNIQ